MSGHPSEKKNSKASRQLKQIRVERRKEYKNVKGADKEA